MHSEVAARVKRAVEEKVFPGCVIGLVGRNGKREVLPFGRFTYEDTSREVREDTTYDIASITKSIPTASLALWLIGGGKLGLSDKLTAYIPEFKSRWRDEVTIQHVLTYAIHGLQLSSLKDKTPDEILQSAYSCELADKPGTRHLYTNLPALLLGLIIERVANEKLDVLAQEIFFGPLGMKQTTFFPQKRDECAPTEIDDSGTVQGIVHDESARVFAKAKRAVGHAGLFSNVPDILNFLESLLRGELKGVADGAQRGWGWQIVGDFLGSSAHGRFGKMGFTGTSVVCDIKRGVAFAILSNRTYPKRPKSDSAIFQFRADIAGMIFGSI